MSLILSGSEGLSDVDGTAATPAIRGTDTNTGIFFPAADTIAFSEGGAEVARFDSVGNFGVGTPNPGTRVDAYVSGTGSSILRARNDGTVVYLDANNGYSYLNTFSNHPMLFGTNNTERMRIDTSGNVGIGTSSPDSKLTVYNATGTSQFRFGASSSYYWDISRDNDVTGNLLFSNNNATSRTTRMVIDTSGNVGIGTSSPSSRLHIQGATDCVLTNTAQSGSSWFAGSNTSAYILHNVSNTPMVFTTNGTERMRIDTSGNLLVGTTSSTGISGWALTNGIGLSNNYSSVAAFSVNSTSSTGTQYFLGFGRGGSLCGSITSGGANSTTYATSSDYRLKENIQPMTGALAKVAALKPCTYKWKADGSDGEGFIAHELQAVVPDAVVGEKDAVDADGNPVYQGIDTSFLVATLTAAIQELKTELDAVKTELAALKGTA